MIAKYFIICEFIAWAGFIIFVVNCMLLSAYYVLLLSSKKKVMSIGWVTVNSLFLLLQVASFIMFLVVMIDPQSLSGLGKLDRATAFAMVPISIIMFVIPAIDFVINSTLQQYWGVFLKNNKICISFSRYKMDDFRQTNHWVFYGKGKKWKSVVKKSKVGKGILEFCNL